MLSRYKYVWKFNKELEREFDKFVLRSSLSSLRLVTFITLFGFSLFLVIDYFRDVDFSVVLVSRIVVLSSASLIMWLSYRRLSPGMIAFLVTLIPLLNLGAAMTTAMYAGMPSYYITNLLFLIFVLVITASGLHFRYALGVNLMCFGLFYIFSNYIRIDPFYFSQYPHLISIFVYIHIVGVVLEMKRRKNFLQFRDLEKQKLLVEDLDEQKNRIISILSHDVAAPMNSLSSLLHLVEKGHMSEKEFRSCLPKLTEQYNHISALLHSLVRWSRAQMEGFVLDKRPVNLSQLIEEKGKLFQVLLAEKKLALAVRKDVDAFIMADKDMIDIALRNLISNAIKFSDEGGAVGIAVTSVGDGRVTVSVRSVGVPISDEQREHLFTYRVRSQQDTKGYRGTGLGLAMTAYFVRLNGGEIYLLPRSEKETVFCLEFSLSNPAVIDGVKNRVDDAAA